mgnify:CR=1 FL=1
MAEKIEQILFENTPEINDLAKLCIEHNMKSNEDFEI